MLTEAEREYDRIGMLIRASNERWGGDYAKDPEGHANLIRNQARLERKLLGHFAELFKRNTEFIRWTAYETYLHQVHAAAPEFDVDVLIYDDALGSEDELMMKLLYDPIAANIALGILSGETIYSIPINPTATDIIVQKATAQRIAELVGKRLLKDGTIVDNPNAKYRISHTTRDKIKRSITTSHNLGETTAEAQLRLRKTIVDQRRAEMIANTELVNAYNNGVHHYGLETGATYHEWSDVGAVDICAENTAAGPIPITQAFPSGDFSPTAHVNCRCSKRLIYPEEAGSLGLS